MGPCVSKSTIIALDNSGFNKVWAEVFNNKIILNTLDSIELNLKYE